jgi:putative MFS transporter
LLIFWYGGYLVSVVVAYALVDLAGWSWRWVLATSALPAVIVLVLRRGLPESPRWLLQRGQTEQARHIIDRYLGGEAHFRDEEYGSERPGTGWRQLFAPGLRSRTVFVCTF